MKKVLVAVTAADTLRLSNGVKHPSGYFLGELYEPLEHMIEADFEVTIATLGGNPPILDKDSLRFFYWLFHPTARSRALSYIENEPRMKSPAALESLNEQDLSEFDALFVPGGHGPMIDLAHSETFGRILLHFHKHNKLTGLICHGPAALAAANLVSDNWPYKGYALTVVSNSEERIAEQFFLGGNLEKRPENILRGLGATIKNTLFPLIPHVVMDRELITGQNPYAAHQFGTKFVQILNNK